jgi:hypothetical protein
MSLPTNSPADQICASANEFVFSSPVSPAAHTLRSQLRSLVIDGKACANAWHEMSRRNMPKFLSKDSAKNVPGSARQTTGGVFMLGQMANTAQ